MNTGDVCQFLGRGTEPNIIVSFSTSGAEDSEVSKHQIQTDWGTFAAKTEASAFDSASVLAGWLCVVEGPKIASPEIDR